MVVVLFAISLVVLLGFAGLVYTGAQALVLRRQLQNAGDAGALAAANLLVIENGCSADGSGGTPRDSMILAARGTVTTNLPDYAAGDVTVSCPTGYNNFAVQVDLRDTGPSYFTMPAIEAATSSTAVNGRTLEHDYAVVLLNPSNPNWRSQRNGCASFLVNGGITVTFEKSVFVNSTCLVADSNEAAVKALNSSFRMALTNGAVMRIGGEMALNTVGKITPAPEEHFRPLVLDPLSGILSPDVYTADPQSGAVLPDVNMSSSGSGICKSQNPCILTPGRYPGGIFAGGGSNASTLLLRPGVYFIDGGGLKLKSASARIFSIPSVDVMPDSVAKTTFATSLSNTDVALNWQSTCPLANSPCGVLIYNDPAVSTHWTTNGGSADEITNGSQGILMLRAYSSAIYSIVSNRVPFVDYDDLVFWQARAPIPGPTTPQPDISMAGGACTVLSGTVYAPGSQMDFGGSSCGSGGGGDAVTALQFIVWDLTLSGNNNFYFAYQKDYFAAQTVYGLVK